MKIWNLISRFASLLFLLMAVFLALLDGMKITWWNVKEILCICIILSLCVTLCYSSRVTAWGGFFLSLVFGLWMESACRSELIQEIQKIYNHVIPLVNRYYRTDFVPGEAVTESDSRFLLVFLALFLGLWFGVGIASSRWRPFLWVGLVSTFFSGLLLGYAPGLGAVACLVAGLGMLLLVSEKGESRREVKAKAWCAGALLVICFLSAVLLRPVSRYLLSYHEPLKAYQLSLEDRALKLMEDHRLFDRLRWRMGGYQKTAVLSNLPPGLTDEVMLELTTSRPPTTPVYLKNFTGSVYSDGVWSDPMEEKFESFAQRQGSTGEAYGRKILTWGYNRKKELEHEPDQITIRIRNHTGSFSPLPYFCDIPEEAKVIGDSGIRVSKDTYQFLGYLNLSGDASDQISIQAINSKRRESVFQDEAYRIFTSLSYTKIPEDQLKRLLNQQEQAWELLSRSRYSFDLDPVPPGEDLVEYFIFEQQKGYCMHFASAYVLLSRIAGAPTRYASGYLVLPQDFVQNEDGTYTAKVPQKRAHAWLEGYSQETGWSPIEVTPGSYYESLLSASQTDDVADLVEDLEEKEEAKEEPKEDSKETEELQQEEPKEIPKEEQKDRQEETPLGEAGQSKDGTAAPEGVKIELPSWFLPVLLSFFGIAVLTGVLLLRANYVKEKRMRRMTAEHPNQGGAAAAEEVFRLLELAGVPYQEGEDEMEFARSVEEHLPCFAKGEFKSFVETVQVLRYAKTGLTPEQQTYLLEIYQKLFTDITAKMNVLQKLWYGFILGRI